VSGQLTWNPVTIQPTCRALNFGSSMLDYSIIWDKNSVQQSIYGHHTRTYILWPLNAEFLAVVKQGHSLVTCYVQQIDLKSLALVQPRYMRREHKCNGCDVTWEAYLPTSCHKLYDGNLATVEMEFTTGPSWFVKTDHESVVMITLTLGSCYRMVWCL